MQGVFAFPFPFPLLITLLLAASYCSCGRLMMPWLSPDYSLDNVFNFEGNSLDNVDYMNDFENEILSEEETTSSSSSSSSSSFDVLDYGAAGNGQTDDSQAFNKAWKDVCSASPREGIAKLQIPQGKTFLLNPVLFKGPCNAKSIHFQLQGTLIAPKTTSWADHALDTLIQFSGVDNLILNGGGKIDGQGSIWWQSCMKNTIFGTYFSCQKRPGVLHFHNCHGLRLERLTHLNSPRSHISINGCNNARLSNLKIIAPDQSPNTDGIDIAASKNVNILDSYIGTGDDCVAINGGSSFINITGVECGPGHGISIGSLGGEGGYDTVEDVHVKNCTLKGTQNGARIKTYQGGSGFARKISFEQIVLNNVRNPIIIDQFYQDKNRGSNKGSSVQVSQVTFSTISGTSASDLAINLNCDDAIGCNNIVMRNIGITSAIPGKKIYGSCNNAHGTASTVIPKVSCLS